jgi:hypothetical protein
MKKGAVAYVKNVGYGLTSFEQYKVERLAAQKPHRYRPNPARAKQFEKSKR